MNRIRKLCIVLLVILSLIICIVIYKNNEVCLIHDAINKKLDNELIYNSCIIKLGDYKNVKCINIDYELLDEEFNQRVEYILDSYNELVQLPDITIDSDDIVSIDIKIENNDNIVYQEKDVILNLEKFLYDEVLKEFIISCKVKDNCMFNWTVPKEEKYGDIAGNKVDVYINVNCIYEYIEYELNDEFIRQKLGYDNVEQFENILRSEMEKEGRERAYIKESYDALNNIVAGSKFNIDRDEIVEYAINFVEQYNDIAQISNMSFFDYGKENYDFTEDEFYDYCYNEAEMEIKQYLVIGAIAKQNNIEITDKMLQDYYKKHKIDEKVIDDNYKNEIECQILTDKVFELIRKVGAKYEEN